MKLTTKSINRQLILSGQSIEALIKFTYYYDHSFDIDYILYGDNILDGKDIQRQAVWHIKEWIDEQGFVEKVEHFKNQFT